MLLPALYGPGTGILSAIQGKEEVIICAGIPFVKGTSLNRMRILTASGPLMLSIPVKKSPADCPLAEIRTDPVQKWQNQHWRSLFSAYGKSPFFGYYRDELEVLFLQNTVYLAEHNAALIKWIIRQYFPKMKVQVKLSEKLPDYSLPGAYRPELIRDEFREEGLLHYRQVFGSEFVPGLCVLDHLFCAGPKQDRPMQNQDPSE